MNSLKFLLVILFSFSVSTSFSDGNSSYMEEWYAKKFNVSLSKAKTRIEIGMRAREIANSLDQYPSISGGMYVENSPKFKVVFNVKEGRNCGGRSQNQIELCKNVKRRISKIIKDNHWHLFASINRVKYSLADLKKIQTILKEVVRKYATDGGKVLTLIQDDSITLQAINLESFKNTLLLHDVSLPVGVKLEELESQVKLSSVFGGADANGVCTFGFVVQTSNGVKGVSTAEHCGKDVKWANTPLKPIESILSRDTQWFELPPKLQETAQNIIVSHVENGSPKFLSISGSSILGVGNPVCMFGAEGGRKCGIVLAVDQILAERNFSRGVTSNFENLTIVTSNGKRDGGGLSIGGDSGGPYYEGHNAVGQVVGGDDKSSYYTPIANVTDMGVSVLTQ